LFVESKNSVNRRVLRCERHRSSTRSGGGKGVRRTGGEGGENGRGVKGDEGSKKWRVSWGEEEKGWEEGDLV